MHEGCNHSHEDRASEGEIEPGLNPFSLPMAAAIAVLGGLLSDDIRCQCASLDRQSVQTTLNQISQDRPIANEYSDIETLEHGESNEFRSYEIQLGKRMNEAEQLKAKERRDNIIQLLTSALGSSLESGEANGQPEVS